MKLKLLAAFSLISAGVSAQQFNISAELRPRFEFRNGYGTLTPDNQDPAAFISQRSRINLDFKKDKLHLYTSLQNVNVWGDVSTLSSKSKNGFALHEAWAALDASSKLTFKIGRQVLSYDDQRIFGGVDWAQQARSHDALVAKFAFRSAQKLDIGVAFNANSETLFDEPYAINQYQNMQYMWYGNKFKSLNLSLLAMNLGVPYISDSTQRQAYSQTLGLRLDYSKNKWKVNGAVYAQTGKIEKVNLSAWYASANVSYSASQKIDIGLGGEYLSGTDQNSSSANIKSFNPWFGTNHKFNGLMDYFYVGNHLNSVGLTDLYFFGDYKNKAFTASLKPHIFLASAVITNEDQGIMDNYLGTEIDLVMGYTFNEYVGLKSGYSQMFGTKSLEKLKGGNPNNGNNWAWVMLTVNPTLFSSKNTED